MRDVGQPAQKRNSRRVGANIKRRRLEAGMTQEDLALATGLDLSGVSKIENGLRDPRLATLITIGRALSVWPGELLRGVK